MTDDRLGGRGPSPDEEPWRRLEEGAGAGDAGARADAGETPDAGASERPGDGGAAEQRVAAHARGAPRPLGPTILLLLIAGVILLGIGLWTGGNDHPAAPAAAAALTIVEPAESATVVAPLDITFATTAPLRLTPMGWQAGQLHLHAIVDGAEMMPGALDVRAAGDGRYRWRLKGVGTGPHDIRLVWARPDHHAIPEGASADVPFTVK